MSNQVSEKVQGRRATIFSVFSAFSLIVCAAFGAQMQNKLGIPANVVYGLAIACGLMTLLLNLGVNLNGISQKTYTYTAHAYTACLSILNLAAIVFTFVDYKGVNNQALASVSIFLFFCLGAIFFLYRLVSIAGSTLEDDAIEA